MWKREGEQPGPAGEQLGAGAKKTGKVSLLEVISIHTTFTDEKTET
jgi:hypothetical protein